MSTEERHLKAGIAALEALRGLLGDAVADAALVPMRARLQALAPGGEVESAQALKQVSILFLDVVGSTPLLQRLDPEEAGAVMNGVLARGTAIVDSHGGKVLQYAGDSLLAAFGAPEAAEDDPERAVRCGLALLELGRSLDAEVQAAHGVAGCNVRVGVHTGGVLLGGGGVGEPGSIHGIAVHVAARMEQTAPPGTLRISHDTQVLVRGLFDVEAQPPLAVKGVAEPMRTYLVQRARPRAFRVPTRGVEGVQTRMIGRDGELAALQAVFERVITPDAGLQRVLVVAEAGVGKSRLLLEFDRWARGRPPRMAVLRARATPQSRGTPYGVLRDLFAQHVRILAHDSMAIACRKFEAGMVPLFIDEDGESEAHAHTHLLGQLIGLDFSASRHLKNILEDPGQIRSRGFHAAALALRRLCMQRGVPVAVQIEDLHWADDASFAFIDLLARVDADVPILLLGLARPTLFERRPGDAALDRIELHPLGAEASRELAAELLKKLPQVPDALRELLAGSAAGNPFYMEELVKMLVERGTIRDGDRWTLNLGEALRIEIPPTLTGVLQARLDGLPHGERHALQLASVIGQQFWDAALAYLDAPAAERLPALSARDLVFPEDRHEDALEYAFKHQILHQVTYDTVLRRHKRAGHAKAAQWLAQHSGARAQSLLARTAEHFDLAGQSAQAAEYYARAAAYHGARFAHEAVLDCCARALQLADADDAALHWRLLATRERTLQLLGRRDEQLRDIEALQSIAAAMPPGAEGDRQRAEAACRRAEFAFRAADWATSEHEARRAMAWAEAAGADREALEAIYRLAVTLSHQFDEAAALPLAVAGLERASALGWPGEQARMANVMADCAINQRQHFVRLQHDLATLAYSRQAGDRVWEAATLRSLGAGCLKLGAFDLARQHLDQALLLVRALGDRYTEGRVLSLLCDLALVDGDAAQARALEQSAVDILHELGARLPLAYGLVNLGRAEQALGQWAAAADAFERSVALARDIGERDFVLRALHAQVELARSRGDGLLAQAAAQRLFAQAAGDSALPDAEVLAGMDEPGWCLTLHHVWRDAGDPRADTALAEAHRNMTQLAETITDTAIRDGFLAGIAAHREIAALWAARAGSGAHV